MTRRTDRKGRRKAGPPFVQLHLYMLQSEAWLSLSARGRAAYVQLASRYNGANNGSLALSARELAGELGCSHGTAARALIEIEDAGFIETTSFGAFSLKNKKASEYRLTIYRCDKTGEPPTKKFMRPHGLKLEENGLTHETARPDRHPKGALQSNP